MQIERESIQVNNESKVIEVIPGIKTNMKKTIQAQKCIY